MRRDDTGPIKTGAFETFGAGRDGADVSCAALLWPARWSTEPAQTGTMEHRAGQPW